MNKPEADLPINTPPVVSPQEWESARQQLLVKEKALTRARDAIEQLVDDEAVGAGLCARSDIRVADSGERWHGRHPRVAEPGSLPPQPRERRQHVRVSIELVRPRAIENEQR